MIEATIIMLNMRGGCATVGGKVHTLFRVHRHPYQLDERNDRSSVNDPGSLSDDRMPSFNEGKGEALRACGS